MAYQQQQGAYQAPPGYYPNQPPPQQAYQPAQPVLQPAYNQQTSNNVVVVNQQPQHVRKYGVVRMIVGGISKKKRGRKVSSWKSKHQCG